MSTMTCDSTAVVLTDDEIAHRLAALTGWSNNGRWIEKTYRFKNFLRAMSFLNAVAYLAESVNHHPDLMIHYRELTVRNWTHIAGGITEHDFSLAARIDQLVRDHESRRESNQG
ncbi:MAG: 4a-hydroxytetrahydrobiopterin dehydratase [Acidobacteriota bacterium]